LDYNALRKFRRQGPIEVGIKLKIDAVETGTAP
jgi:hypothetical protein